MARDLVAASWRYTRPRSKAPLCSLDPARLLNHFDSRSLVVRSAVTRIGISFRQACTEPPHRRRCLPGAVNLKGSPGPCAAEATTKQP